MNKEQAIEHLEHRLDWLDRRSAVREAGKGVVFIGADSPEVKAFPTAADFIMWCWSKALTVRRASADVISLYRSGEVVPV